METIKNIAAVIGCVMSFVSLVALCTKAGREAIKRLFNKYTKEIKEENARQAEDISDIKDTVDIMAKQLNGFSEILKQQCRNTIKDIYYKYAQTKKIPLYERKTADATFKLYKDIWDGNSYATLLYGEIQKWEIDPTFKDHEGEEDDL